MLDIKSTNKFSIFTIKHWDKYQSLDSRKTADGQQMDTFNNVKNDKKIYVVSQNGDLATLEEVAQMLLTHYNKTLGRAYRTIDSFLPGLTYWIKTYPPLQIATAISRMPGKKFFGDIGPEVLFRRSTPTGEKVDYIGSLLNKNYQKQGDLGQINSLLEK